MTERAQVLVVGSVNVDLVVTVAALPRPGETVTGGTFAEHDGGKGANQAVAAARAGADVRICGAVGDDPHGRRARAALEAAGVDTAALATVDAPTGVALITVAAGGENAIAVASGANHAVDPAGAAAAVAALDPRRAVVVLSLELDDAPLLAAARQAHERGITLVLNPAPARPLDPALLACAPLLTPNAHEASTLAGIPDPAAAARTLSARTGAPVVVTLGAAGALVVVPGGAAHTLPAPRVDVVDTTGAGDVFTGVLATTLASLRDAEGHRGSLDGAAASRERLHDAAQRAVAAAAAAVSRPGARG